MDRFSILKGISPPSSKLSPFIQFDLEGIHVVIVRSEHIEWSDKLKYTIGTDFIPKLPKPYCMFVSNSLTEETLKGLFLNNREESMFSFYRKHVPIRSDQIWTQNQMCILNYSGLNFLKYIPVSGFHMWSDNIVGSIWNGLEIQRLSTHRLLYYITNLEGALYHKYIAAKNMDLEVKGDPFISFTLKIPGELHCLTLAVKNAIVPNRSGFA